MATSEFNRLPGTAEALQKAVGKIVRKCALDIQAGAQERAPVATGYLKNSVYTVTSKGSSYGQGGAAGGKAGQQLLPEVEPPPNETTAYVAVGAEYGLFVELGTRFTYAQPFLGPAADAVKPQFDAAMSRLESALRDELG